MRTLDQIREDLIKKENHLKCCKKTNAIIEKQLCKDIFDDYEILKYLENLNELTSIKNEYGIWEGLYRTTNVEMFEIFYANGICCECSGDDFKAYFLKE